MVKSEKKAAASAAVSKSKTDTGSSSVQVTAMTERIKQLTDHLKSHKKDFAARRGLLQLVGQRKKQLRYLASQDSQEYLSLIQKLGIRR